MMVLCAMENDVRFGGKFDYYDLPGKASRGFGSGMDENVIPYKNGLESIFYEGCNSRDVDRVLWVYGH